MLLTGVIVASGFIGRYIYTAVPRSANGIELSLEEIESEVTQFEQQIRLVSGQTLMTPELRNLTRQRDRLRRQAAGLVTARRMLALWHAVHIPIGLTLFVLAFVHVGAAIYYASLLH
jgi:hypothetical protein